MAQSLKKRIGKIVNRNPDFIASPGRPNRFSFRSSDYCDQTLELGEVVTFSVAEPLPDKGEHWRAVDIRTVPPEVAAKTEKPFPATARKTSGNRVGCAAATSQGKRKRSRTTFESA